MYVTIHHRDALAGLLGDKRKFLVDVNVDFSQEERAIIEKRKLYDTQFDLTPGFLASSVFFLSTPVVRLTLILSPLLFLSGCVVSCASSAAGAIGGPTTSVGGLLMMIALVGFGLGIYGVIFARRGYRTDVTIAEMMKGFSVLTFSPPDAKAIDELLRERLVTFKDFLNESAELGRKESFEV
jgi:hypothetical protein